MKVLFIPDIFYSNHSGAIAARVAADIFSELSCEVRVFTSESKDEKVCSKYYTYPRKNYTWKANYFEEEYKSEYLTVLNEFNPDLVFIFGGIVNKPKCYIEKAKGRGIKVGIFLLVQDFYCANLHAALYCEPCFKCIQSSIPHSFINSCAVKSSSFKPAYLINYSIIRKFILKSLKSADYVISSTDEQLNILHMMGLNTEKLIKCPLFFDINRVNNFKSIKGDYLVVSGQSRREKGLQLLPLIIDHITVPVKIKIPFYDNLEAIRTVANIKLQKYIDKGIVEILPGTTWTNGGEKLVAESLGIINPTIWPTTTEFVFLETLGYGKPIFTFAVGIHKEIITCNENGFVSDIKNYKMIGKQIDNLVLHEDLYYQINKGANNLFNKLCNKESFQNSLKKIIH